MLSLRSSAWVVPTWQWGRKSCFAQVLSLAVCSRSFNSSTLHLLWCDTSAQCWLYPKQFYTPPSHTDQTDPPSPPHFPCSTSIRGARHNTVAGRASITHVWSRCSYTWCFTRMLLEQQLELRRIIAYTSWVLPRERAVCKFSRTSQWGTGASGSLMPRRCFYPCLMPLR